jgi:hypothetical protein
MGPNSGAFDTPEGERAEITPFARDFRWIIGSQLIHGSPPYLSCLVELYGAPPQNQVLTPRISLRSKLAGPELDYFPMNMIDLASFTCLGSPKSRGLRHFRYLTGKTFAFECFNM